MFRDDKLTVKREVYEVVEGSIENERIETVEDNVPCHLSVNLTTVVDSFNVPYLLSDFTLFVNGGLNIKPNDILIVATKQGQIYELFAGEIKMYGVTTQIKCRQEKIIEK